MKECQQFQVRLKYVGAEPMLVHKLRAILKELGRRYGFNCVGLKELPPEVKEVRDAK